ncbi:regulatory protein RecX [Sporomusa acidovorans]|nr:regulatory protein RecX [Sporomusa acidovorans]
MDAVKAAIKILRFRTYSRQELEQKLLKQGYDEATVKDTLEYATKRGYLNDTALCNMLLAQYSENNKYSLKEIYLRLKRRGLPSNLINEKLSNWDADHEYHAALKLAVRYFDNNGLRDRHKIVRRLSNKGYNAATVRKVLEYLRDMSP